MIFFDISFCQDNILIQFNSEACGNYEKRLFANLTQSLQKELHTTFFSAFVNKTDSNKTWQEQMYDSAK